MQTDEMEKLLSPGLWRCGGGPDVPSSQPPLLLPAQGAHTVEEERDALGECQGRHQPMDLEDIVPGRGSGGRGRA
jgi:hypothetical protein